MNTDRKIFTFIVVIYNEEKVITYLLDSIKYQIETFGSEWMFQLILADDASRDGTCAKMDKWLSENEDLFYEVTKLYSHRNQGTCRNLANAFRQMKGEVFYLVAGDDMLARDNMFSKYKLLQSYDIVMNGLLAFEDKKIVKNPQRYLNVVLQGVYSDSFIRKAIRYGCPILNGAIIRKELITETVLKSMEHYKLLEDRSRYYAIFEENVQLKCTFDLQPIVLCRNSENSVSSVKSVHKSVHDTDLENLYDWVMAREKSYITKIFVKIQKFSVRFRGRNGFAKLARYATPYYISLLQLIIFNRRKVKEMSSRLLTGYAADNEAYIRSIVTRSR